MFERTFQETHLPMGFVWFCRRKLTQLLLANPAHFDPLPDENFHVLAADASETHFERVEFGLLEGRLCIPKQLHFS